MQNKLHKIFIVILMIFVNIFIFSAVFTFAEENEGFITIDGQVFTIKDILEVLEGMQKENGWAYIPDEGWVLKDITGNLVKNTIARKDGLKFYLDETGHVLKNHLVTVDNDTYYCNYFGAFTSNAWIVVDSSMVENKLETNPQYYWYYFNGEGKAVKGTDERPKFFTIDGSTYLFNAEGQMLSGWIKENGEIVDPLEVDRPYEEATYFANDDGSLMTGWMPYENTLVDDGDLMNMEHLWFYFDKKTHKKRGNGENQSCNIGPSNYVFSDKGYVLTGFTYYNSDNSNREEYFGDDKSGIGKYKARWAYTLPPKDGSYTEEEKEQKNWMYMQKSGTPIKNAMRKINEKYYAFDEKGIMKTGIVAFLDGKILFVTDMDKTSGADIVKKGKFTYKKDGETYYFYDAIVNTAGMTDYKYYAGNDQPDLDSDNNVIEVNDFATMDSEVNQRRDFRFTGRREWEIYPWPTLIKDDIGLEYNPNIKYFYFSDAGDKLDGQNIIHMIDKDYIFASNKSGHYHRKRGDKYYYDGILLAADDEIGYGLLCVEDSLRQAKQYHVYYHLFVPYSYAIMNVILVNSGDYDEILNDNLDAVWPKKYDGTNPPSYDNRYRYSSRNTNESIYKVVNSNGKIVKSRKESYKDKQGRYWFIDGKNNYCFGIFETPIKRMKSKLTFNTIFDFDTCPEVFKTGTKQEMIDYFRKATCTLYIPGSDNNEIEKFIIEDLLTEDIKDYYTFIRSGTITDVNIIKDKEDPSKFQISIMYDGVHFKSDRNDKYCFIPFGVRDDGDRTATFFPGMNDFEIIPEDNDLFVNATWADTDAVDLMDRNGDGEIDYH